MGLRFDRRMVVPVIFAGTTGLAWATERKLELLFVDRSGCPWCTRFEQETMAAYLASDLAKDVPLKRASLDDGQPRGVILVEPVRFTPTFVLLEHGREVARIVGYRDNATFFGLIEKQIADQRGKAPGQT
jgi:thioredoxin-related protein